MSTSTKLTLEEFLALPETKPGSEFIDGEVVQKSMPSTDHTIIQRLLSFVFTLFLRDFPIAEGGTEWRCIFGPAEHELARLPDFAQQRRSPLCSLVRTSAAMLAAASSGAQRMYAGHSA
jgi:Uma2 family endonuclease